MFRILLEKKNPMCVQTRKCLWNDLAVLGLFTTAVSTSVDSDRIRGRRVNVSGHFSVCFGFNHRIV
jgi:hypothetical protein